MSTDRPSSIPATRGYRRRPPPRVDGSTPLSDDARVEIRVTALEKVVIRIDETLKTLATREDLHKEAHAQTWRFVTYVTGLVTFAGAALTAAVYFIATHAK